MTETLSTSKEVPKTRLALEEKYKNEPKEPHAKRLDPDNIQEISNLQKEDEKEQNDGNVIDIKGSTKN